LYDLLFYETIADMKQQSPWPNHKTLHWNRTQWSTNTISNTEDTLE